MPKLAFLILILLQCPLNHKIDFEKNLSQSYSQNEARMISHARRIAKNALRSKYPKDATIIPIVTLVWQKRAERLNEDEVIHLYQTDSIWEYINYKKFNMNEFFVVTEDEIFLLQRDFVSKSYRIVIEEYWGFSADVLEIISTQETQIVFQIAVLPAYFFLSKNGISVIYRRISGGPTSEIVPTKDFLNFHITDAPYYYYIMPVTKVYP